MMLCSNSTVSFLFTVYSWFAIFEYMLVFSNVSFHSTWLVMEFSDALLVITVPVRPGQYASLPV